MAIKKVVLYPGYIHSIKDGEPHYIGIGQLMKLYNVQKTDKIFISKGYDSRRFPNFIHLKPSENGDDYYDIHAQLEPLEDEK